MSVDAPRHTRGGPGGVDEVGESGGAVLFDPFVSVPALVAALRRLWWTLVLAALLGAGAGLGFSLALPPPHTATTILLLRHPAQADQARAMATDGQLLETRVVAQRAIESLGLQISAERFLDEYEAAILTRDLLQITVEGPNHPEAVRRADAVAAAFLSFRAEEFNRQSEAALAALEDRAAELRQELAALNERIESTTGPPGGPEVRVLGELLTRRSVLNDQLSSVRQRIDAATLDVDAAVQASRVIDPAGPTPRSPARAMAVNMIAGAILGVMLAGGSVVFLEVVSDRVRRREDVAEALRAPVAASLGPLPRRVSSQRRLFVRHLAKPRADVARVTAHLRRLLAGNFIGKPALAVVSVDSDPATALVVAWSALDFIRDGQRVLVVDLSGNATGAHLFAVTDDRRWKLPVPDRVSASWPAFPPTYASSQDLVDDPTRYWQQVQQADVVLALAAVDPSVGADHLAEVARTALVVVTAGRAARSSLRTTSEMLEAAGVRLVSALVVDADRRDTTAGLRPADRASRPLEAATRWGSR